MADKLSHKDIVRVEKIKDRLNKEGVTDVSDEEIVSLYLPERRAKRLGMAFLRLDKVKIFIISALALIAVIFIFAFMQEKAGNFTINLDRLELFRKGISISADADFTSPTARLIAQPIVDVTNISASDVPADIDNYDGDHSGENYLAYTYYVRNAGKETVDYLATLTIASSSKGVDEASRVAIWRNTKLLGVYAKRASDGEPEVGTLPFESDRLVFRYTKESFQVGDVDKYTVVIWLEGDDPECVDKIVGGGIQFSMDISAANDENEPLITYYLQDIVDSLVTGDKPINPAGTDSPDFDEYSNVTWQTRHNQDNVYEDVVEKEAIEEEAES
ncbi:MAG: hypothetical protein IJP43_03040 [Oscillospiraceae bacterium]|nr:hypothetical protein [Oscillospiraceae bacterium]